MISGLFYVSQTSVTPCGQSHLLICPVWIIRVLVLLSSIHIYSVVTVESDQQPDRLQHPLDSLSVDQTHRCCQRRNLCPRSFPRLNHKQENIQWISEAHSSWWMDCSFKSIWFRIFLCHWFASFSDTVRFYTRSKLRLEKQDVALMNAVSTVLPQHWGRKLLSNSIFSWAVADCWPIIPSPLRFIQNKQ